MRIAQITDLHVAEDGTFMRSFVDANAKLAAAVAFLEERSGSIEAVLITGDVTNDGHPEQYALLRELLDPLTIPTYVVPGNHDDREEFRAAFADRPWVPAEGPIDYVIDEHEVRLVGIDTTEPDRHDGLYHPAQAEWLDATLAERPDVPTVLFGHHPPFLTGLWLFDAIRLTGSEHLRAVVDRHPQVRLVVSGHVHARSPRRGARCSSRPRRARPTRAGATSIPTRAQAWWTRRRCCRSTTCGPTA